MWAQQQRAWGKAGRERPAERQSAGSFSELCGEESGVGLGHLRAGGRKAEASQLELGPGSWEIPV